MEASCSSLRWKQGQSLCRRKEVLNKLREDLATMSRTPLSFGYFDQNRSGWNALNFVGLMDDFRVYDIALTQSEIDQLYGDGSGDVSIVPTIMWIR